MQEKCKMGSLSRCLSLQCLAEGGHLLYGLSLIPSGMRVKIISNGPLARLARFPFFARIHKKKRRFVGIPLRKGLEGREGDEEEDEIGIEETHDETDSQLSIDVERETNWL